MLQASVGDQFTVYVNESSVIAKHIEGKHTNGRYFGDVKGGTEEIRGDRVTVVVVVVEKDGRTTKRFDASDRAVLCAKFTRSALPRAIVKVRLGPSGKRGKTFSGVGAIFKITPGGGKVYENLALLCTCITGKD